MIYYKILWIKSGRKLSLGAFRQLLPPELVLEYKPVIRNKSEYGPLFVFDSRKIAAEYLSKLAVSTYMSETFEIWEVEVGNPRYIKHIVGTLTLRMWASKKWLKIRLQQWFSNSKRSREPARMQVPIGTIAVDWVKLQRWVYRKTVGTSSITR